MHVENAAAAATHSCPPLGAGAGGRLQVWPFFSTPLRVFGLVIGPIAGSMVVLALLPGLPVALRLTAGVVAAVSLHSLIRGYANRIEAGPRGIRYRGPGRDLRIRWEDVRHLDRYTPLDRNRTTQYVYVTRLAEPPVDWREIDENTIQLQDRPGLLESLREHWLGAQMERAALQAESRQPTPNGDTAGLARQVARQ